jgi:hypothetical protein
MDMTRHLRRWLNDKALSENFGDSYEGRIAEVTEEVIRNRFKGTKQLEPVVVFEDGWRLLPNINQRRALIEFFGPETEEWRGRRLVVFRHSIQKINPETGLVKQTFEKRVMLPTPLSIRREA